MSSDFQMFPKENLTNNHVFEHNLTKNFFPFSIFQQSQVKADSMIKDGSLYLNDV